MQCGPHASMCTLPCSLLRDPCGALPTAGRSMTSPAWSRSVRSARPCARSLVKPRSNTRSLRRCVSVSMCVLVPVSECVCWTMCSLSGCVCGCVCNCVSACVCKCVSVCAPECVGEYLCSIFADRSSLGSTCMHGIEACCTWLWSTKAGTDLVQVKL